MTSVEALAYNDTTGVVEACGDVPLCGVGPWGGEEPKLTTDCQYCQQATLTRERERERERETYINHQ